MEGLESAVTKAEAALASQRPASINKLLSSFKRRGRDETANSEAWSAVSVVKAHDFFTISQAQPHALPQP